MRDRAEKAEAELRNLLAIIHRDGGHHTSDVGLVQSVEDAHKVWGKLITERNQAIKDNEQLRAVAGGKQESSNERAARLWSRS